MSDEGVIVAAVAGIRIDTVRDITDAVGACFGAAGLILAESDLDPAFFDLRTGLLGELLQKFVNYRIRVALVVPEPERHGPRFAELAYEHRGHGVVRIVPTMAAATAWLE